MFGGPGDADESPPTFNYEVQVFAFDPIALAPTGAALYASGPQIWTTGVPVINPVTFAGLNLTLNPATTYILIFRPEEDADSRTLGQIHQNLSDPYSDGQMLIFFSNAWHVDETSDLSIDAVFGSAAVPEPATLGLTGFALIGAAVAARRRRR